MTDPHYRYHIRNGNRKYRQPVSTGSVFLIILLFCGSYSLAQTADTAGVSPGSLNDTANTASTGDSSGDNPTVAVPADSAVLRTVKDATIAGYKKDRDFEYANDPAYWKKQEPKTGKSFADYFFTGLMSDWVRLLVYALLIAGLCFAVYKIIVVNKLYLFYTAPKKQKAIDAVAMNPGKEDFDEQIKQAEQDHNYRLAVRYRYLKTLRLLNDKGLIRFHLKGTNQEYLTQMAGKRESGDFRLLTRFYEYIWYGEFAVSEEQFTAMKQHFDHFYNTAGN